MGRETTRSCSHTVNMECTRVVSWHGSWARWARESARRWSAAAKNARGSLLCRSTTGCMGAAAKLARDTRRCAQRARGMKLAEGIGEPVETSARPPGAWSRRASPVMRALAAEAIGEIPMLSCSRCARFVGEERLGFGPGGAAPGARRPALCFPACSARTQRPIRRWLAILARTRSFITNSYVPSV